MAEESHFSLYFLLNINAIPSSTLLATTVSSLALYYSKNYLQFNFSLHNYWSSLKILLNAFTVYSKMIAQSLRYKVLAVC